MFRAKHLLPLLVLLAAAEPAAAQGWRRAAEGGDKPNRTVYFVDAGSIRRTGNTIRFWTTTVWEEMTADRDFNRSVTLRDGDCNEMTSAVVQNMFYDGTKLLETDTDPRQAVHHSPDSVMYGVLNIVCGRENYEAEGTTDPAAAARSWFQANPS